MRVEVFISFWQMHNFGKIYMPYKHHSRNGNEAILLLRLCNELNLYFSRSRVYYCTLYVFMKNNKIKGIKLAYVWKIKSTSHFNITETERFVFKNSFVDIFLVKMFLLFGQKIKRWKFLLIIVDIVKCYSCAKSYKIKAWVFSSSLGFYFRYSTRNNKK